jgi:hypothetical protein
VLSLDALRALGSDNQAFQALKRMVNRSFETIRENSLVEAARIVQSALEHTESWLAEVKKAGTEAVEAGARRFALTLGRAVELALLIKHAQWSEDEERDRRATAAAKLFASSAIDLLLARDVDDARALLS